MDFGNVSKIEGENYKNMLKEEALFRIKTGNFTSLLPLVQSLTLSKKDIQDIFSCWLISGYSNFIFLYGYGLKNQDETFILKVDEYLNNLRKQEEELLMR